MIYNEVCRRTFFIILDHMHTQFVVLGERSEMANAAQATNEHYIYINMKQIILPTDRHLTATLMLTLMTKPTKPEFYSAASPVNVNKLCTVTNSNRYLGLLSLL